MFLALSGLGFRLVWRCVAVLIGLARAWLLCPDLQLGR